MMPVRLIQRVRETEGRTVCVVFGKPPLSEMSWTMRECRSLAKSMGVEIEIPVPLSDSGA